jgi:integrase
MIQPWENPRSKFYWFRRRVPTAYRQYGMPAEIKFSLNTENWDEAVELCQDFNLELERRWRANLIGTPPTDLSHLQIVALAGEFYAETVAAHRDEPGRATEWQQSLEKLELKKRPFIGPYRTHLRVAFGNEAQMFLRKKGIMLVGDRLEAFVKEFVSAQERAMRVLKRNAQNDYTPDEEAARYPKFEQPKPEQQFDGLWKEFCEAKQLAASTRKKWEPYFEQLCRRVKSRDMSRVTEQHLLDWRDALLASKATAISVKFGQIAAVKAFFGWSKRMKKLPTNPSVDVVVEISDKHEKEMRGFTDEEAAVILAAALAPMNELMSDENAAARKWVPWLCAYTGARVNELTQLRACDVIDVAGIPCIRITPEAGTVKTSKRRTVPLHPHLIEMEFLVFARKKKGKTPLFYSIERQRNPNRKNPTYTSVGNKLAEWVRKKLGIKDELVAPNHGWRHRFKTVARRVGMNIEARDAIQGHATRTEGEKYGEVPVDVMLAELRKYPRYKVVAANRRDGRRSRSRLAGRDAAKDSTAVP